MAKEFPKRPPVKTSFKHGNIGKQKGTLAVKTQIAKKITTAITADIAEYMSNGGLQTLLENIERLPLKEQVNAQLTLLEYYKPKLGRQEIVIQHEKRVISVFGKQVDDNDITDIEPIE